MSTEAGQLQRGLYDRIAKRYSTYPVLRRTNPVFVSILNVRHLARTSRYLAKDEFRFASAAQIPRLLDELDQQVLGRLTPCKDMREDELARAIATVHVELILIHPFREGNGRIARFVADIMASQAGMDSLDYSPWDENKQDYIKAIHAGMDRNYVPMERLVSRALGERSGSAET